MDAANKEIETLLAENAKLKECFSAIDGESVHSMKVENERLKKTRDSLHAQHIEDGEEKRRLRALLDSKEKEIEDLKKKVANERA